MQDTIHFYYRNPDDWYDAPYPRADPFRFFIVVPDGIKVLGGWVEYAGEEPQWAHVWARIEAVEEGYWYVQAWVEGRSDSASPYANVDYSVKAAS